MTASEHKPHISPEQSAITGLVRDVIAHPERHDWTLQGFGMLRTYIGSSHRLHVWDARFAVEDVSEIHTHPWDMRSYVVAGEIRQFRFTRTQAETAVSVGSEEWMEQTIKCGEGGGLCGVPRAVTLYQRPMETYTAGQSYVQSWDEIHLSRPERGTVTLVERTVPPGGDPDYAYVFFKGEWVSAEPRRATNAEVHEILAGVEL